MLLNTSKISMEQIFHGQFSLYDAAIFGCKYIKNATFTWYTSWYVERKWHFMVKRI